MTDDSPIVSYGSAEGEVVPYSGGWRGEFDAGRVSVMSHFRGYPGVLILSIVNTDSRCPGLPTPEHPEKRAEVYMTKPEALKLRDALNKVIEVLPDDGRLP